MSPDLKDNLLRAETYKRLAFMIMFVIVYAIAEIVMYAVAIVQFFVLLFTGKLQEPLKNFGASLSAYMADIIKYLTFASEYTPFPFEPWEYGAIETDITVTPKEEPKKEAKDDTSKGDKA